MATATSHNKKSSAVKRILSEARELSSDSSDLYTASPLEDNIFEWHFTLRGPANTEFSEGLYHGRILLPAEYPMRPPNLMMLTPNGRWELNKKICLTFTGFHEEMWQPAWGIRTALLGLQTFMTAKAEAAVGIGSLDYPLQARQKLAKESRAWKCDVCQKAMVELLPDPVKQEAKGGEDEKDRLPEGLMVDLDAKSHKPSQARTSHDGGDGSKEGERSEEGKQESTESEATDLHAQLTSPLPPPPVIPSSTNTVPTSSTSTPAASPNPLPPPRTTRTTTGSSASSSIPHLRTRPSSTTTLPPVPSSAIASTTTTATATATTTNGSRQTTNRLAEIEQRLTLIDNCMKGLGILVVLLLVKQVLV